MPCDSSSMLLCWCVQLWPTDLIPPRPVGKMVLDTNVDNFFAETDQIAFCPAITVPGAMRQRCEWHALEFDALRHAHCTIGTAGLPSEKQC